MIDPVSMIAAKSASSIIDRLLNADVPASNFASTPQTQSASETLKKLQETLGKDLQKFLDNNQEIKAALGEGPYELKLEGKSLTLSGSRENKITVSTNSNFGQKALLLSEWGNSNFFEKGLELQAI